MVNIWNTHHIRRSRNPFVPSGRPNALFFFPEIRGAHDEGCQIITNDMAVCNRHCSFRASTPCEDQDVYDLCILLVAQHNYRIATNAYEGLHMYKQLRQDILSLL